MGWWHETRLTYARGMELMNTARSKKQGKPINYRLRLFIVGENLEVRVNGRRLALIRPNNTAVLFFPPYAYGHFWGKYFGLYRVTHPKTKKPAVMSIKTWLSCGHSFHTAAKKHAVPAIDGLEFDFETETFINPQPWPERKQTDKAGPWRGKVSKFRRTMKLMAKMGAFDSLMDEVWPERRWEPLRYPPLTSEELYNLIISEQPYQMVRRLMETMGPYWLSRDKLREGHIMYAFDTEYNRRRDAVRELAGCYIEETPHAEADHALASTA